MENNNAVAADELRVTVEMGDDFTPSDEVQTALDNLRDALAAESDDVEGFEFGLKAPVRNMSFNMGFTEIKPTYKPQTPDMMPQRHNPGAFDGKVGPG